MRKSTLKRSTNSLLIESKEQSILIYGYALHRIEYYGINHKEFSGFYKQALKFTSFCTLKISSQETILILGFIAKTTEDCLQRMLRHKEYVKTSLHLLPDDVELQPISGYSLASIDPSQIQLKSGTLHITDQLVVQHFSVRELRFQGNISALISGLLNLEGMTLQFSQSQERGDNGFRLSFNLTNKIENIQQTQEQLIEMIRKAPNVNGKIDIPSPRDVLRNFFSYHFGTRHSILEDQAVFFPLLDKTTRSIPISSAHSAKRVYPPYVKREMKSTTHTGSNKSSNAAIKEQAPFKPLAKTNLEQLLEMLSQKSWVIVDQTETSQVTSTSLRNKDVTLSLFYTAEVSPETVDILDHLTSKVEDNGLCFVVYERISVELNQVPEYYVVINDLIRNTTTKLIAPQL